MAKQSMRKFKRLLKGTAQGGRTKMTKSDWQEVASTLGRDAGPGVRRRANPTKAQKREKAKKASAQRRVALALAKFLKQANPAMKTAGATVTRLKGGGLTIRPIKAVKRGRR